jgi:hypothetical protein
MSTYPPHPPSPPPQDPPPEPHRPLPTQPPPPPVAPAPNFRRRSSLLSNNLVRIGAIAVIAVAIVVAIVVGSGGSANTQTTFQGGGPTPGASGPAAAPFHLSFPSSWSAVPASGLAKYPGSPAAVLLRQARTGLIVVTRARTNPKLSLSALGASIAQQISARFHDARTVGTKLVKVKAGKALYYAFLRTQAGTVNAVLVVPAGAYTYELNSVVPGNQPHAATEVGQIFLSFKL